MLSISRTYLHVSLHMYLLLHTHTHTLTHTHTHTHTTSIQKTFAPTIPTSRRIKKEPGTPEDVADDRKPRPDESPKGKKRRPSSDKKGGREQKKKGKKEVITAASVFSMGPADRPSEGRTG